MSTENGTLSAHLKKIIKKVLDEINASRDQILSIIDNIRSELEVQKKALEKVKVESAKVIVEVDELERKEKLSRKKLVEVSGNFNKYSEHDIKKAYENASELRVQFLVKKNEEKIIRERRDTLEIAIKKSLENIESAEKVISQISIAIGYLDGHILADADVNDKNTEMFVGIKILEAQEYERKRIARDIHDGPAQHMANIILKTEICKVMVQKDLQKGLEELADLKESVKLALKDVRRIIFDLRPMSLDDLGLERTIHQIAGTIIQEYGMDINLKVKPVNDEIETIIQVAVYRIIQEVFNNIVKHAKAKQIDLKMDYGDKFLSLMIEDDGIGFNVDETLAKVKDEGKNYGLIGIFDRVNQMQGEINIKSFIGKGTTYKIKLPVKRDISTGDKG